MNTPTASTEPQGDPAASQGSGAAAGRLPIWANPRLGLIIVLAVLVTVFSVLRPSFLDVNLTIVPMQAQISVYLVVGLAQLAVLSLGHMNLAVGPTAALSGFAMGFALDRWSVPIPLCVLIGLIVGALIGALAGLIIATTEVNSFVVTLALNFALLGLVSLLYNQFSSDGTAFQTSSSGMQTLRQSTLNDYCVAGICGPQAPLVLPIALTAALVVGFLFQWTRLGREVLMTGSNMKAAELSGIPTKMRIVQAHALSGMLAGLAGFLLAVNNGAFSADIGQQFMLPSFLVPVLGGTLLTGGSVSVIGAVLGACLTVVITQGLNLLQFQVEQLNIFIGGVLLLALSLDRVRHIVAERRGGRA